MSMSNNFIINNNKELTPHVLKLMTYMESKGVKLKPYPTLIYSKDKEHKNNLMGPTAWYEPDTKKIKVITEGRHPKDILRSISHELIHHNQNICGKLQKSEKNKEFDPNYAQNDEHLRKMEEDAYLRGNLMFRDWTDSFKKKSD